MDINFERQTHYVFPVMGENRQTLRLESLRYAPNGQGGNLFGPQDILESLAVYGIQHHVVVKSKTKEAAVQQALRDGFSTEAERILGCIDEQKFIQSTQMYGSLDTVIRQNHAYKVELKKPGYTVGDQLKDLKPGDDYRDIGTVFAMMHPSRERHLVKGIVYNIPTWHEGAFGKQHRMAKETAVIYLGHDMTKPKNYLISAPDEFNALFRGEAIGLQTKRMGRDVWPARFDFMQ